MNVYVDSINTLYEDLNKEFKPPSIKEAKNRKDYLKSVVAKRDLKKGDLISENNITLVRPGTGIPPSEYDEVIGKKLKRNITKGNVINWIDINR